MILAHCLRGLMQEPIQTRLWGSLNGAVIVDLCAAGMKYKSQHKLGMHVVCVCVSSKALWQAS